MTLSTEPIYTMISIALPGWLIKALCKIMRSFSGGGGTDVVQNGKCLVAWPRVQRPLHLGGLGISDLKLMGITLRARWLWLHRTKQHHSWASLPIATNEETRVFFDASVQFVLSDGNSFLF
jgi:hypothetical protein